MRLGKSQIKHKKKVGKIALIGGILISVAAFFYFVIVNFDSAMAEACYDQPVSTPLNDLGTNTYVRMDGTSTNYIGGLYSDGSNSRPPEHEQAGVAIANAITPLDTSGQPDPNGKIVLVSIGMSNNMSEFYTFMKLFDKPSDPLYPQINSKLKVINGAKSSGTLDKWSDPDHPLHNEYWNNVTIRLEASGLTYDQVQTVWIKTTETDYLHTFPENINRYTLRMRSLVRLLKVKFPNIKIAYISSRTRAHSYVLGSRNPEPYSFETGLAVRQVIVDQISGDPSLNYDPTKGVVEAPYLSWGPYLWINGDIPRSDGRIWNLDYVTSTDCVHPTTTGMDSVASMLWDFFTSDTTAVPWFSASGIPPTPTPTPTTTPTATPTPTPTPTATPTPTPDASDSMVANLSFGGSEVGMWDELNSCSGCTAGSGVTWNEGGWFDFNNSITSFLNLSTFPYLYNLNKYTLSIWMKPDFDSTSTSTAYVLSNAQPIRLTYIGQVGRWRLSMRNTAGTVFNIDSPVGMMWSAATWHNITVTYDGSFIKLYWDGALKSTKAATGAVAQGTTSSYLGKVSASTNGSNFIGSIDDLKVFNYALTVTDIENLYSSTLH